MIDLQDIVSVQKIRTESETVQFVKDPELKQYYQYTYFIQINLASVNGIKMQHAREASEASSVSDVPRARSIDGGGMVLKEEEKEDWTMLEDGDGIKGK